MKKFYMPVEHLRRIRSVNQQAKTNNIGSVKYLPHSLFTLISTVPMPWEESKIVEVLYHVNGSLCFVNSKNKITKEEFVNKWNKINENKISEGRCMKFPIFEDDEEIFEYRKIIQKKSKDKCVNNTVKLNDSELIYSYYLNLSNDKITNFTSFERRKKAKLFCPYQIPLINLQKNNLKHLKKRLEENKNKYKKITINSNLKKHLKNTRFFQSTEMEWIEVGLIIIKQAHEHLSGIIKKKKLSFIYLDFNFNLKQTRPLTTKERKKSRLGVSFHLTREISKLLKLIVDAHIVQRRGLYSSLDLCFSLKYAFSNVGILTGIYRYKYKTMKQIKICKDLENIYNNWYEEKIFNLNWCEQWRVYVYMMRGYNSLLQKYLGNMSDRLTLGREYRIKPLKKQRLESNLDLELKREIVEKLKDKFNKIQINLILRHMNEAWRCWKADINYEIKYDSIMNNKGNDGTKDGVNDNTRDYTISTKDYVNEIISQFVNKKASWYISNLHTKTANKKEINKKMGKITRLYIKEEKERQRRYLERGSIYSDVAVDVYKSTYEYFQSLGSPRIGFPDKNEIKHLQLAVMRIKGDHKEEDFFDGVLKEPEVYIYKIKKSLLTQRKFREVQIKVDEEINVIYTVNHIEKLTDAFLSSYLFYEADCLGIFPEYFKPGDEIDMKVLYNFSRSLKHPLRLYEGYFKDIMKTIENNLLRRILLIFIDPILVDYIICRNNCTLVYKDMFYDNHLGFISGFAFSPFIFKIYLMAIDFYALREFVCSKKILRFMQKIYLSVNESMNNIEIKKKVKGLYNLEIIRVSSTPHLTFEMAGVDCEIFKIPSALSWDLENGYFANLKLSSQTVESFGNRIEKIVLSSQSSTFLKVVTKWNSTVSGFVNQFREIIPKGFFISFERMIRNVVKKGINSKMPIRFPSVIFYAPQIYGGLGMYNLGLGEERSHIRGKKSVDEEDKSYKHQLEYNKKSQNYDTLKDTKQESNTLPTIFPYFKPWLMEIKDSEKAWDDFKVTSQVVKDVGLPRMSTLLQKNKIAFYERSFRLVRLFKKFSSSQYDPLPFTSVRHDGPLFNLENYPFACLEALGGVDKVLRHTLFQATYARKFDKLFWDDSYLSIKTNTKAQKRGLSQIPNRRFIFWWSPTINRANVYVGYETLLEPTGIVMHGKLPTLKLSYLNVFKNNLWKKIHECIVFDFQKKISPYCEVLKLEIPSRKASQFKVGYPDLLIKGPKILWIDIQLRWGDYDRMDPKKYARVKYVEYTSHYLSKYPTYADGGILIVFDLCYNVASYYIDNDNNIDINKKGDHSKNIFYTNLLSTSNNDNNSNITFLLNPILETILKNNVSLHILRERIRSSLDIYTVEVLSVSSPKELFHDSLIVEDRLLFTKSRTLLIFDPSSGSTFRRQVPLEEGKKPKVLRNHLAEEVFRMAQASKKGHILGRKEMIEILKVYQVDYPTINLKILENDIPFHLIPQVGEGNLYKNWFGISKFTSFCRLILIIQSIRSGLIYKNEILPDKDWIKKEREMKDKIVERYCEYKVISPNGLSEMDIRDIIFGCFNNKDGDDDNELNRSNNLLDRNNDINENFINAHENKQNHLLNFNLNKNYPDLKNIKIIQPSSSYTDIILNSTPIFIPKNILILYCSMTQPQTTSFCLLAKTNFLSLLFIPQYSTPTFVFSSSLKPKDFEIIGLIINTNDRRIIEEILERYKINDPILILIKEIVESNRPLEIVEEEGGCYMPEFWDYSRCKEYYNEELEYELKLGIE